MELYVRATLPSPYVEEEGNHWFLRRPAHDRTMPRGLYDATYMIPAGDIPSHGAFVLTGEHAAVLARNTVGWS